MLELLHHANVRSIAVHMKYVLYAYSCLSVLYPATFPSMKNCNQMERIISYRTPLERKLLSYYR